MNCNAYCTSDDCYEAFPCQRHNLVNDERLKDAIVYILESLNCKVSNLPRIKHEHTCKKYKTIKCSWGDQCFCIGNFYHYKFELTEDKSETLKNIIEKTFQILFDDPTEGYPEERKNQLINITNLPKGFREVLDCSLNGTFQTFEDAYFLSEQMIHRIVFKSLPMSSLRIIVHECQMRINNIIESLVPTANIWHLRKLDSKNQMMLRFILLTVQDQHQDILCEGLTKTIEDAKSNFRNAFKPYLEDGAYIRPTKLY
jgi:hypothetical protein